MSSLIDQIAAAIVAESDRRFLPCGGLTKPALTVAPPDVMHLDMTGLSGILTYEPSEFLITARAGTRVDELQAALAEQGQYLPCDPLFGMAGSTLGGTVASGISGSNRLLYGGLRDFVMELELIDGTGARVRGGGKVVKNAAGFDLPKLLVGSYGRMGIITEVTLKVFPKPPAFCTLEVACQNMSEALALSQQILAKPLPISALDVVCGESQRSGDDVQMLIRFGGPVDSLPTVLDRAQRLLSRPGQTQIGPADAEVWQDQSQFIEQPVATAERLLRIASDPASSAELESRRRALTCSSSLRFTGGGSAAWMRYRGEHDAEIDLLLNGLGLSAIVLAGNEKPATDAATGECPAVGLGNRAWRDAANRIQRAVDPRGRFLQF